MSNHSGPILGGTCIRPPRSALAASKLIGRLITATELLRYETCLRIEREGSVRTGDSGHFQMLLITSIVAWPSVLQE
jgi:hypothetical protein